MTDSAGTSAGPRNVRAATGRTARALGVTALVSVLVAGCSMNLEDYTLPGGADVGDDPLNVAIQFDDVLDLVLQSSVKIDGVDAGRVTGISLAEDG